MTIRTLQLNLGTLSPQSYTTGWWRDPTTGQFYYYDATSKTWYIQTAGILVALEVPKEAAPKVVDISGGDTLRIEYNYKYAGPAISVTEYASIGYTTFSVYDEIVHRSKGRSLPQSSTPTAYTGYLDIVLPVGIATKCNDIECKVYNGGRTLGLNYQDALNIIGVEVTFSEFAVVDYYKKV